MAANSVWITRHLGIGLRSALYGTSSKLTKTVPCGGRCMALGVKYASMTNVANRPWLVAALCTGLAYLVIRYTRSPAAFFDESTVSPMSLISWPDTKPRIECFCHPVALAISPSVAPSLRRSSLITSSFLLHSRAAAGFVFTLGRLPARWQDALPFGLATAFLAAGFLAAALAGLAAALTLVRAFLGLLLLVEAALDGEMVGPCAATAALWAVGVVSGVVMIIVNPFWRIVVRAPRFIAPKA
jgi:hypothetical protein